MRHVLLPASLALALACAAPASAAVADDVKICVQSLHDIGPVSQSHVQACTLAVNSGELDDRQLSMVLFARASLRVRSGLEAEARRDYTQAAMLNRSPAFVAFVKGAVARAEGDAAGTVRALSEALSHSPDSVDMLVWRAEAFANLDRMEEALQDYDRALTLAPTLLVARLGRGAVLIGLGRAEQAVSVLDALRRQYPDHAPTLLALARARLDVGDILGAVAASDGLEDSWPGDAGVRFNAARVHLLAGDIEGGLQRLGLSLVARDIWFGFEARVLHFLISRESTPSLHAGTLVDAARNQGVEAWHLPMAQFLATAFPSADPKARKHPVVTVEQLVEVARETGREHVVWFYVAEARRLKGDTAGATAAFRQVVESGLMDTWEYRESIQRLRTPQ